MLAGDSRLGVIHLDTRQGIRLTLPPDRAAPTERRYLTELARGSLGVITRPSDKEAMLTIYAQP